MKRRGFTFAMLAVLCAGGFVAHSNAAKPAEGEQFVGSWVGSWEGGGGGKFDMKLEQGADGAITGGVEVGTDMGDYKATFHKLSFTAGKMSGQYDYPPDNQGDNQGEIILEGNFEAAKASGTWTLVQKGGKDPFAGGTWAMKKN